MIITTSCKYAKIQLEKGFQTYPLNTISYTINTYYSRVSFFHNNKPIATEPMNNIEVNNTELTEQNSEQLLSCLFSCQCQNDGDRNETQYIAGDNITFTTNTDSSITISANGESAPIIHYASNNTELPASAKINELGYITSDGSPKGELTEIYEFDGFNWVIKSFKSNLSILNNKSYDWILDDTNITYDRTKGIPKLFLRSKDSKYDNFRIIATDKKNPIGIEIKNTLTHLPKISENDGNYYFTDIYLSLVEQNTIISNWPKIEHIEINHDLDSYILDKQDKIFSIENNELSSILVDDYYLKELNIGNIYTEQDWIGITMNTIPYESITLKNIEKPIRLNFKASSGIDLPSKKYGNRIWNFSNMEFDKNSGLSFISTYVYSDHTNHTTETWNFSNVKLPHTFQMYEPWISEFNISNVEMMTDENNLRHIRLSSVKFKDQESCDTVCTTLATLLGPNDDLHVSIGNAFTPSQAVVNEIVARGINYRQL